MNLLYLIIGLLVFIAVAMDIIKTTFSSSGGGKITDAVSKGIWKAFFYLSGKKGRSKFLKYAGPSILVAILLVWVLGLWSGLFIMLLSDSNSIIKSSNLSSTNALEKLYYAGFTLSTLGVGDYIASNNFWRIVTSIAAFSGLAFITASITYFVPVLSAVGLQSKLSSYISSMGKNPQQVLVNSWNGESFDSFFLKVTDLCQMLMQHTVNHHSYPVVHYFHNSQLELSITRSIVLLDETHTLLKYAVSEDVKVSQLDMTMLETALNSYLEMVKENFIKTSSPSEEPPMPDLEQLAQKGIPVKGENIAKNTFELDLVDRRKNLTSLLEMDGWSWKDLYQK